MDHDDGLWKLHGIEDGSISNPGGVWVRMGKDMGVGVVEQV